MNKIGMVLLAGLMGGLWALFMPTVFKDNLGLRILFSFLGGGVIGSTLAIFNADS